MVTLQRPFSELASLVPTVLWVPLSFQGLQGGSNFLVDFSFPCEFIEATVPIEASSGADQLPNFRGRHTLVVEMIEQLREVLGAEQYFVTQDPPRVLLGRVAGWDQVLRDDTQKVVGKHLRHQTRI